METFGLEQEDRLAQVRESLTAMDFREKAEGAQVVLIPPETEKLNRHEYPSRRAPP